MFSENLKLLRKQKGMTQDALAEQLHVVRQTVSKWEKGLSVPDAELLIRISELFEVSVSELLGEKLEERQEVNEVANQLALLNEQLAARTRRSKRILRGILIGLLALFVILPAVSLGSLIAYRAHRSASEVISTTELICTLDGEEYYYEVRYNQNYQILEEGGDAWIADHVMTEQYSDANVLIAQVEDYFKDRGGSVEIVEKTD